MLSDCYLLLLSAVDAAVPPSLERNEEHPVERSSSMTQSKNRKDSSVTFTPPANSVSKNEWVKDEIVSACMQCGDFFSMVSLLWLLICSCFSLFFMLTYILLTSGPRFYSLSALSISFSVADRK